MLEHRPVLKERLLACVVFGALAVGVVAASDTLVTGGFDFPSTERGAHADTPSYFQIATDNTSDIWAPRMHARTVARTDGAPTDAAFTSYQGETLVGAADDVETRFGQYQEPSEDELRREISEMYAALPRAGESYGADHPDESYSHETEAHSGQAAQMKENAESSAYGNASPW